MRVLTKVILILTFFILYLPPPTFAQAPDTRWTKTIGGAQSQAWHQGISFTNINVRGNPVVVAELNIDVAVSGNVLVRFDGLCIADVGDRIVLAASNTTDWGINDGNVSVEPANADVHMGTFSHTRLYSVAPGNHTFYAVAENYEELDGNGIAPFMPV